jgi:hypothetical protein
LKRESRDQNQLDLPTEAKKSPDRNDAIGAMDIAGVGKSS